MIQIGKTAESRWTPLYRDEDGGTYTVTGIESDECPVSIITPESRRIVEMDARNRRIKEASGAAFPSAQSGEWPAWWADAVAHLELMHFLENEARIRAQRSREAKRRQQHHGR